MWYYLLRFDNFLISAPKSIAGGETTSTFLAATTYHLLKNPEVYAKLKKEIRNRYASYEEIDSNSALQLPYIQAIISEGLRIYPPGSQGFPRVSPGSTIDGHWVPSGVRFLLSSNSSNNRH
jgi:cytochrome P450